jgi:hypothetical protein
MTSTYTSRLKLERQGSGENAGNWGNLVNYVFNRVDSSVKGYQAVSVAGSANVTLTSNTSTSNTDDSTTDDQVHNAVLEFTGALTGNIHVFTDAVESQYILFNNTSGSFTLTFANTGHAANGAVITQGNKAIIYSTGSSIVNIGMVTETATQTLTNKTLTSPALTNATGSLSSPTITTPVIAQINDANGNEELKFTATASAVNEITITNAATGSRPNIAVTGGDTNIGLSITTKGTGLILFNDAAYNAEATLTDGATITWDVSTSPVAKVTLGGNRTISAPTNGATGQFISLAVIQDGTGSRTLTWNSVFEFTADTAPTLTTTASKADLFVFRYNGTVWYEMGKNLNLSIT